MKKFLTFFTITFLLATFALAQEDARLLRFPAVFGEKVVFTYAGDLFEVSLKGGTARRLTSYEDGYEMFARFSPDGKHIAFTGQYDGNTEVYLISSEGGIPLRLTYTATLGRDDISDRMGPNNIVMTWSDNDHITYRSRKQSFNSFKGQLFNVSKEGGLSEELPLPTGGWCSYSPDGKKMAYNRVFREFRTWKYYKGGMADDVWIYDFETKETINITNNDNQNIFPMWAGDKIYFLSDRDRTMNLFVHDLNTNQTTKLTTYTEYDIKFPSLGDHSIVFENGGYIYNYELATGEIAKVTVTINNDLITGRNEIKDASKFINSWAISPDGKRVVFGARGDVFTVPAKSGITRNLTQSSGVHDRNVEWSPDGKYISFISDRTGEDEIYIQNQNGLDDAVQLTFNSDTYKYNPIWSPDSKHLLWGDKMGRLNLLEIASKNVKVIYEANDWEIRDYSWSPDNSWVAFTEMSNNSVSKIKIYGLNNGQLNQITDDWYNAGDPVFDTEGKYLFFSSARDFNPIYSWTEWNHAYRDMNGLYFVTLQKDTPSPFEPKNDEVEVKEGDVDKDSNESNDKNDSENKDKNKEVKIDFDGITDRVVKLPVKAGNYWNIQPMKNSVYYIYNSAKSDGSQLKVFNLEKKKETDLGKVNAFVISEDQKKMLISMKGKRAVIDLPKGKIKPEKYLDLSGMKLMINLQQEWAQIYNESWRQMRDFFYAPNMHGLDWPAINDK